MPNYERPSFSPQPKAAPQRLVKAQAKTDLRITDDRERRKCHQRSQGRCEVRVIRMRDDGKPDAVRCVGCATENHHLIGGSGRRNIGRSILAAHRLDVCARCHGAITGNVLVPIDGTTKEDAALVRYQRIVLPQKSRTT